MVKIRLQRMGTKKVPAYRLVVADSRQRRDGAAIEVLGTYLPSSPRPELRIEAKADRVRYWLGVGAQPTDTAWTIIKKIGAHKPAPVAEVAATEAVAG